MNIFITGGGMENKGAQAMVFTVMYELGRRFPNSHFYIEQLARGGQGDNIRTKFVICNRVSYRYVLRKNRAAIYLRTLLRRIKNLGIPFLYFFRYLKRNRL